MNLLDYFEDKEKTVKVHSEILVPTMPQVTAKLMRANIGSKNSYVITITANRNKFKRYNKLLRCNQHMFVDDIFRLMLKRFEKILKCKIVKSLNDYKYYMASELSKNGVIHYHGIIYGINKPTLTELIDFTTLLEEKIGRSDIRAILSLDEEYFEDIPYKSRKYKQVSQRKTDFDTVMKYINKACDCRPKTYHY